MTGNIFEISTYWKKIHQIVSAIRFFSFMLIYSENKIRKIFVIDVPISNFQDFTNKEIFWWRSKS